MERRYMSLSKREKEGTICIYHEGMLTYLI